MHFLKAHLAHTLDDLKAKLPMFTFASVSAQNSEHCNKIGKERVLHLYAFLDRAGEHLRHGHQ